MTDHDGGDSPYDDFLAKGLFGGKEKKQVAGDDTGDDTGADSTGGFGGEEKESLGDRAKSLFDQGKEKVGQAYNTGKQKVEEYRQAKRDKVDQERMDQFHSHDEEAREREAQEQKAREESGESGRYEDRTTRGEETDAGGRARKKETDADNEKFAREKWEAARRARLEELQNNPELFDDDPLGDDRSYGIYQNEDGTFGLDDTVNPWARTDEDAEQEAREKRKAEEEENVEEGVNPFDEPEEREAEENVEEGVPGQDGAPGEQEQPQDTIYQDPKAQEIYAQHAKKFLQGAGQTLAENWGEGVSKGWDMAQNLVKMTLTQPSAMSSASRLIGMNLAALQTASDFQDKASARYNINVNADPKLVQDTLRYKLYKRDMQQGGQIVGNTFRTIAQSLSRYGGDMSNMSPSELSGHMRDMQGEKDRLLAALAEPNLKPSDRRLLTAQAQHLQSYMSGIAKQARSLQAQQAETNRFLKNEDYQRRMRAYDTLPTGEANPFSAVLHEASPKGNLEVDPDTGMPRYTAGLNAAMKTIDSMIQRIGADGSMSPQEKQARIAELKNLYAQMGQKLVRMRQEGNRARVQDYGAWAQKLAENNPVLANNMGERMGAIFERGEYPIDATSLRRILAEVDRMRQSSDPEEKAAGDMFYADIVGFSAMNKTVTMLNNFAKDSLRGDEAAKMHIKRAKELNGLLDRMKAIPRPDGMEGAVYDATLRKLEGQARLETMMAGSFSNPAAIGDDDRAIRAAQKKFHDRVFEAVRTGEPFDINSPAFQEAYREYDSAVRKLAYKYEGKGIDEGWLNDVRRFVAQNGDDDEGDDTGGAGAGGAGGGPGPNDDEAPPGGEAGGEEQDGEVPPNDDEAPPGGEAGGEDRHDDEAPPGGGDEGKPKPKTKKQVRMEAVVSGILNEGETMSDEDRAVIEQMYDNGLFKFNGDDTLKDPASLSPATRKTLIGKIDGILAQEGLSDRARELITEYRNALAGLDEKKEKDEEKGDDRIDPNEYFSKPPEDIVKDLIDRGVLIDKDGKVQFTMADADIKKTAKAFGMSVANFKKAVAKALKGTKGAGAGAGANPGEGNNDAGGNNNLDGGEQEEQKPKYAPESLDSLNNLPNDEMQAQRLINVALGTSGDTIATDIIGKINLHPNVGVDKWKETAGQLMEEYVRNMIDSGAIPADAITDDRMGKLKALAERMAVFARGRSRETNKKKTYNFEWPATTEEKRKALQAALQAYDNGEGVDMKAVYETVRKDKAFTSANGPLYKKLIQKYKEFKVGQKGEEQDVPPKEPETPPEEPPGREEQGEDLAGSTTEFVDHNAGQLGKEGDDVWNEMFDRYDKLSSLPKEQQTKETKEALNRLTELYENRYGKSRKDLQADYDSWQFDKAKKEQDEAEQDDEGGHDPYDSMQETVRAWNEGAEARKTQDDISTYDSLTEFSNAIAADFTNINEELQNNKRDKRFTATLKNVGEIFYGKGGFKNNYDGLETTYNLNKNNGMSDSEPEQVALRKKMATIEKAYNRIKDSLEGTPYYEQMPDFVAKFGIDADWTQGHDETKEAEANRKRAEQRATGGFPTKSWSLDEMGMALQRIGETPNNKKRWNEDTADIVKWLNKVEDSRIKPEDLPKIKNFVGRMRSLFATKNGSTAQWAQNVNNISTSNREMIDNVIQRFRPDLKMLWPRQIPPEGEKGAKRGAP